MPPSLRRSSLSQIWCRDWGSRPVVGSSRISSSGSLIRERASTSRLIIPPESSETGESRRWSRAIMSSRSIARRRASCLSMSKKRAKTLRFSRTVSSWSRLFSCWHTPVLARIFLHCLLTSIPKTSRDPAVIGEKP